MDRYSCLFAISSLVLSFSLPSSTSLYAQIDDERFEQRVLKLLIATEFKIERREILNYGDRVLPILEKVLSSPPKDRISEIRVSRALTVLRDIGGNAAKLRPLVRQYLLAESSSLRFHAVETLGSIGSTEDIPILVAMLYDPDSYGYVRYQAVKALGKFGDESALLALEIWQKQAVEADKQRPLQEKWIIGSSLLKEIDDAKAAIKQRIARENME